MIIEYCDSVKLKYATPDATCALAKGPSVAEAACSGVLLMINSDKLHRFEQSVIFAGGRRAANGPMAL
jgi:hypothetical protein